MKCAKVRECSHKPRGNYNVINNYKKKENQKKKYIYIKKYLKEKKKLACLICCFLFLLEFRLDPACSVN